jgi:pyruvate formate lyase activating enzyme
MADPVEKKPFHHVLPGSLAMSFGMLGCNFHCGYCQNWITSQTLRDPRAHALPEDLHARSIVERALETGCRMVVSTYNEPLITAEWAREVFTLARAEGLLTGFVSNGNATPQVLDYLRPVTDLYKVDLKSFRDRTYRGLGGTLGAVTDTLRGLVDRGFWVEVVTLLVPGLNDGDEELADLTAFLADLDPDIPWHVTGFRSDYRMQDREATRGDALQHAAEIGERAGLRYVYAGNRPGSVGSREHTRCHSCGELLVERRGFHVLVNRMREGSCPACATRIPGVWIAPGSAGNRS